VQSLVGEWLGSPCVVAPFVHFSLIGIASLSFLLPEISNSSPARAAKARARADRSAA